jgi:hypothetical protein
MPIINNYDIDANIDATDFFIGISGEDGRTRRFSATTVSDFVQLQANSVTDTNFYLENVSIDSLTGDITFTVNGAPDLTLALGTASLSNEDDFATANHTHMFSDIATSNVITSDYLNVNGIGTLGQVLTSDGTGGFVWENISAVGDTNFYLNSITQSGNSLTFSVLGGTDHIVDFGEGAFLSLQQIVDNVQLNINVNNIVNALGGLAGLNSVGTANIDPASITASKIQDGIITEQKLNVSNPPQNGYVLTSDGSSGFSWVLNSSSNYFVNNIARNGNALTFELAGGAAPSTFASYTLGEAAYRDVGTNLGQVADGAHTHDISTISNAGVLATLDTVNTAHIDNSAITVDKISASGSDGQFLTINSGSLAWETIATANIDFLSLPNTPSSFSSQAGRVLKVNSGETALEFVDFEIDLNSITTANVGAPGKVLSVDSNGDLTWINVTTGGIITIYPDDLNGITTYGTPGQTIQTNGNGTFSYHTPFDYEFSSLLNTPTTVSGYGITDAMTAAHDADVITSADISNWNTAYGWGDHSVLGYLTAETDPIFTASAAGGITATQVTNWDTAHGWGDHSTAGYITAETDPIFTASAASAITNTNITQWNTAYSWGDHSTQGYINSETNTSLSLANNILTYTDENGAQTDLNLSLYLDDTNLARLTGGNLNGSTGIATFTRDDNSTFDVDFSSLLGSGNTFVNSATFNSGTGLLKLIQNTGTEINVDLDGRYLEFYTETSTLDDVINRNGQTTNTAVIPFYYADQNAFPSPTTFHGAMAHSHADGTMFYAHQNAWQELANADASNLTNAIGYTQTANEFKTSTTFTTDVDFSTAAVFTQTLSADLTMTFSNAGIGMTKILLITGGNGGYTLTFPAGATKLQGTYDDTAVNFIQVTCTGSGEYYYTISQPA